MNQPATSTRSVDMSPAAIAQRLRDVSQLYELGMFLARCEIIGPVEPPQVQPPAPANDSG